MINLIWFRWTFFGNYSICIEHFLLCCYSSFLLGLALPFFSSCFCHRALFCKCWRCDIWWRSVVFLFIWLWFMEMTLVTRWFCVFLMKNSLKGHTSKRSSQLFIHKYTSIIRIEIHASPCLQAHILAHSHSFTSIFFLSKHL